MALKTHLPQRSTTGVTYPCLKISRAYGTIYYCTDKNKGVVVYRGLPGGNMEGTQLCFMADQADEFDLYKGTVCLTSHKEDYL